MAKATKNDLDEVVLDGDVYHINFETTEVKRLGLYITREEVYEHIDYNPDAGDGEPDRLRKITGSEKDEQLRYILENLYDQEESEEVCDLIAELFNTADVYLLEYYSNGCGDEECTDCGTWEYWDDSGYFLVKED